MKSNEMLFFHRKIFDLHSEPMESNELLAASDCTSVPWVPLTPALILPYHLDFERIPLTFCPRNKRIEIHFIY
jgi:hypothetical protein